MLKLFVAFNSLVLGLVAQSASELKTYTGLLMDTQCSALQEKLQTSVSVPDKEAPPQKSPSSSQANKREQPSPSRTPLSAAAKFVTVREKYAQCKVSNRTEGFALHSDGRVLFLDAASNERVRKWVESYLPEANKPTEQTNAQGWFSVTVQGRMQGERLSAAKVSGR
jgi:hypothetical protein